MRPRSWLAGIAAATAVLFAAAPALAVAPSPDPVWPYYAGMMAGSVCFDAVCDNAPAYEFAKTEAYSPACGCMAGYAGTISAFVPADLQGIVLNKYVAAGVPERNGWLAASPHFWPDLGVSGPNWPYEFMQPTYNGGEASLWGGGGVVGFDMHLYNYGQGTPCTTLTVNAAGSVQSGQSFDVTGWVNQANCQWGQPLQQVSVNPAWGGLSPQGAGSWFEGILTAPVVGAPQQVELAVTAMDSNADYLYGYANVTVVPAQPPSIQWFTLTPGTVSPGGEQISARVGTSGTVSSVTLSLPWGGTVSLVGNNGTWTGTFTAPTPGYGETVNVQAAAGGSDGTVTATAPLQIIPAPYAAMTVSPSSLLVGQCCFSYQDQTNTFGGGPDSPTWTIYGPNGAHVFQGAGGMPTSFQQPGTYMVTLQGKNAYGVVSGNTAYQWISVTEPQPVAGFTVTPNPVQMNDPLYWVDEAQGGPGAWVSAETWTVTDAAGNVVWSSSHAPSAATFADPSQGAAETYLVTQAVENNDGQWAYASQPLTVTAPAPNAAFTMSPDPMVTGWQTVTYTDQSTAGGPGLTITAKKWTVAGPGVHASGSTSASLPVSFKPGQYTVTLEVQNSAGVTARVSHILTVQPQPTMSISVQPGVLSVGGQVTVKAIWSGWDSMSIDAGQVGGGIVSETGTGSFDQTYTLGQKGTVQVCATGSIDGTTREQCASATGEYAAFPVIVG